ncbi:oligosaccharide flippase family protein [Epilithonimonas mollis]|uniref:Membrane protein involved in the export of O-antigen and teichoic acid n=1 Tax=Epilithonimonas mollis TaxID=216903 RepID=A0A1M6PR68_9FLAO|nr:oligosaccharide flippase family protein [Epilithonimonas mollis]SHK10392.1 Membrane protein involved in the export of O-antigen and teichoic acid [Epilithonimonas mollis]
MNSLKEFLSNFLKNKGHHVFLSFLIAKICGFLGSIVIIRLLPENEYGILSIVMSVYAIFLPFSGLGSNQILLRYGSISQNENKQRLSSYLFYKGLFYEILLVLIFIVFSLFYENKYDSIFIIFLFCGIRLMGFYLSNHIQTYYRITGKNNVFANVNNAINIGGFIILLVFTYFWKFYGYLIAMSIIPYLSLFWLKKAMFSAKNSQPVDKKEMWRFGIFTAATSVISETLFSLDVILLGILMNENAVANYKVAILLPSNIPFLVISFMQSDYPLLSKNYRNKAFLVSYIRNYYKIFIPICFGIFVFFYFFKDFLLTFFFGANYVENSNLMMILLLGFTFGMLSRNLFGNLLPAVGKIEVNTWISALSLLLLCIVSYFAVASFGVVGMGISLAGMLVWEGLAYMFFFRNYLNKLS